MIEVKQIDQNKIDYLIRNLENFEKDKAVKKGLYAAGQVLVQGGKKRLRDRMKSGKNGVTGNLLNSFQVRVKKYKPGVLAGFKQGVNGGSHSHLVDLGSKERFQEKKNDKSVGKMPANLFWHDTENLDNDKALKALYNGIEKAVEQIERKK